VSKDDAQIDELLAGGHLGGPQHDQILRRVLDRTASPPRRRWASRLFVPGLVLVSALGVWLILVRPADDGRFSPRGFGAGLAAVVDIGCGPSGARVCRAGDTLLFKVNAAVMSGYLGAYAERADASPSAPSPERIWYFPTTGGTTPAIAHGGGTIVLSEGIRIGAEHRPGKYRITVWIANRPVRRPEIDELEAGAVLDRGTFALEIAP
jgi:hypothetical protein